jgi:hypothetical protein
MAPAAEDRAAVDRQAIIVLSSLVVKVFAVLNLSVICLACILHSVVSWLCNIVKRILMIMVVLMLCSLMEVVERPKLIVHSQL